MSNEILPPGRVLDRLGEYGSRPKCRHALGLPVLVPYGWQLLGSKQQHSSKR